MWVAKANIPPRTGLCNHFIIVALVNTSHIWRAHNHKVRTEKGGRNTSALCIMPSTIRIPCHRDLPPQLELELVFCLFIVMKKAFLCLCLGNFLIMFNGRFRWLVKQLQLMGKQNRSRSDAGRGRERCKQHTNTSRPYNGADVMKCHERTLTCHVHRSGCPVPRFPALKSN